MDSVANQMVQWAQSLRWVNVAEIIFVALSVVGQHFNSAREVRGFYFWLVGNIVAVGVFYSYQHWVTLALYLYYSCQCVIGIFRWRKLDRITSQTPETTTSVRAELHPDQAIRGDAVALGLA